MKKGVCISALVLFGVSAHAKTVAVVVQSGGAGSDKAAGAVEHFAKEFLVSEKNYSAVDLDESLGNPDVGRAKQALKNARELVAGCRADFESLDLDGAANACGNALKQFEKFASQVSDTKLVAEALMLLGAAYVLRDEEKQGIKKLQQAFAMMPDIEPDPSVFNPSMRQTFNKSVEQLQKRPLSALVVDSKPDHAMVYLDNRFVGVTPLTVEKVMEGKHLLRVVKAGYRSWGKMIELNGGNEAAETATLKPAGSLEEYKALMGALSSIFMGDQEPSSIVQTALKQMGGLLNAETLLLSQVRLDGERVQVMARFFDVQKSELSVPYKHGFGYSTRMDSFSGEVSKFLKDAPVGESDKNDRPQVLPADLKKDGGDETEVDKPADPGTCLGTSCQHVRTLVLWIGTGSAIALLGGGGVLQYLAKTDNDNYRTTPQRSPEAQNLLSSGKLKAGLGDGLVLGGVLVAGTATLIYFLWNPPPPKSSVASSEVSTVGVYVGPYGFGAQGRVTF